MTSPYDYAAEHFERFKAELRDWVAIPSISTDPSRRGDVRQAAEWLADDMRRIGLQNVAVMETDGHPVVYGDWLGAGDAPTVLVYGHYDVQPAVIEDGWDSDPFIPVERENFLLERGSTADKGQVLIQAKVAGALLKPGG